MDYEGKAIARQWWRGRGGSEGAKCGAVDEEGGGRDDGPTPYTFNRSERVAI